MVFSVACCCNLDECPLKCPCVKGLIPSVASLGDVWKRSLVDAPQSLVWGPQKGFSDLVLLSPLSVLLPGVGWEQFVLPHVPLRCHLPGVLHASVCACVRVSDSDESNYVVTASHHCLQSIYQYGPNAQPCWNNLLQVASNMKSKPLHIGFQGVNSQAVLSDRDPLLCPRHQKLLWFWVVPTGFIIA